jgi:two-component system, cell cycle response regulator DivK
MQGTLLSLAQHDGQGNVPPAASPLVLIVDDNEDNREVYGQYLAHEGYRVVAAEDGEDALVKAVAYHPDVIVMDLAMPRVDGLEATRRLKARTATKDIPVIALTGHAAFLSKDLALAAGAEAYLTKPCLPQDLAVAVQRCLGPGHP